MVASCMPQSKGLSLGDVDVLFDGLQEPLGFEAGDTNVTRYVGNGVLNAKDPSGLEEARFDVQWNNTRWLTGRLMVNESNGHLLTHLHVRRPIEDDGFKDRWNGLDGEVPDEWDREAWGEGWIWPHLYMFLNGHKPRYGGYDPYKAVDNDYGAILIRKYDESGKELTDPKSPLVSNRWHPVGGDEKVSHVAGSEQFTLNPGTVEKGVYKVWFAFLDLFGKYTTVPDKNGKAPRESAGETLAYFEIPFCREKGSLKFEVKNAGLPAPATGFEWPRNTALESRLAD